MTAKIYVPLSLHIYIVQMVYNGGKELPNIPLYIRTNLYSKYTDALARNTNFVPAVFFLSLNNPFK